MANSEVAPMKRTAWSDFGDHLRTGAPWPARWKMIIMQAKSGSRGPARGRPPHEHFCRELSREARRYRPA